MTPPVVPHTLVDTHCHLNHEQFDSDLEDVVARARENGVRKMVVVGYDLASSDRAVELARRFDSVFAAVAVHPHDARHYDRAAEIRLRDLAHDPRVVAIGEIGLDYHYDFSPREDQFRALHAQIVLAREADLPVILHCREAYADLLDMLEANLPRETACVMHCWAGSAADADRALGLGCYLGFGGVLTFKNAAQTRLVAASAPRDRLLLETDAPYLAPVPYRGKRNEPAHTRLVAEKLAEIRGVSTLEIAVATCENARRTFPRMNAPA